MVFHVFHTYLIFLKGYYDWQYRKLLRNLRINTVVHHTVGICWTHAITNVFAFSLRVWGTLAEFYCVHSVFVNLFEY